ncbi:carbonic anhydrase [Fusarium solani]|uniref:Carbonic anhydrase n=1 Tax=Fusarium solani TaxID=169388 RepID=A0A9P9G3X2_FUSSL|nr:carbonic anhydrase [Fusarium solani]KAH7230767.1 carbonic anhydrase [Fusarium solani]
MANHQLKEFLEQANIVYRRSLGNHQAPPLLQDLLSMSPKSGSICILTCSDARVDPNEYFGLKLGEALVIRNAGGRATDAFRSLEVMGTISPIGLIVVVHHTDCGGLFTTEDEIRSKLSNRAPTHASAIKDKWFGTFRDVGLDESIRQDVEEIRQWPFLPAEARVVGYALDIETGVVREVVP